MGRSRRTTGISRVPAAHVAYAVLHGEHARLRRDVELGLEIVGRLRRVRILEQDQRQAAFLVDRAVAILRRALLVAEAQPAVRRIDQPGLRAGRNGALRLLGGDLGAFERDAGDDRNPAVGRLHEAFGSPRPARPGVRNVPSPAWPRTTRPLTSLKLPSQAPSRWIAAWSTSPSRVKGVTGAGDETAEIEGFHDFLLMCCAGSFCGRCPRPIA